ncbi:hypothetical protein [Frondihabitans cladoniiphilus]|uniref:Uncharacterized protein n=1 Tax=Frondihabitans cladoniiphilus TaxID=715785 RepID=A0ABP8VMP7_9MICO
MTEEWDARGSSTMTAFLEPEDEQTVDRTGHRTGPHFPVPPERASLDDDDLVPLVARHTTDTATIDLIGILQAQLQLRAAEAASFRAWEDRMRQIGTDEALGEVEKTRLRFTGVIPVQVAPGLLSLSDLGQARASDASSASAPAPAVTAAPSSSSEATTDTATTDTAAAEAAAAAVPVEVLPPGTHPDLHDLTRPPTLDDELAVLDPEPVVTGDEPGDARPGVTAPTPAASTSSVPPRSRSRILAGALAVLAALVVAASLLFAFVGVPIEPTSILVAVAVLGAAWIGLVVGRVALRSRAVGAAPKSAPVTPRTAWALVVGLVAGVAVGQGLVLSSAPAFTWQGYLARALGIHGLTFPVSAVVGVVAALVVSFVVVVVVERAPAGADDAGSTPLNSQA